MSSWASLGAVPDSRKKNRETHPQGAHTHAHNNDHLRVSTYRMGQTPNACRKSARWPDSRSWIDLVAVRESLLNCVAASTGAVDLDALSRIEFEHNRRVVGDALRNIPVGASVGIVKTYWSDPAQRDTVDRGTLYLARRECGRFGLARGGLYTWTAQEAAEAIAAVSLSVHIYACGQGDPSHHIPNLDHIWERSWIRAATVALGDGPGQDSWTAHTIDSVGAVLRTLVALCDDRAHNCRVTPAERFCSLGAVKLAAIIASSFDLVSLGTAYGKDWARVADTERSLRGMLAWIDAMERTDVLFEHMLKRYQAERIDRTIAADSRVATPPNNAVD